MKSPLPKRASGIEREHLLTEFGYDDKLQSGEKDGCGGPGLVWLHVVCGCEAGWTYCQIT
jgi:hypothetical protein